MGAVLNLLLAVVIALEQLEKLGDVGVLHFGSAYHVCELRRGDARACRSPSAERKRENFITYVVAELVSRAVETENQRSRPLRCRDPGLRREVGIKSRDVMLKLEWKAC